MKKKNEIQVKKNKRSLMDSGDAEKRILKKENKRFWVLLGTAAFVILIIILVACIIDIYNLCAKVHPYFGIGIVVLICLLLLIFIVRPIAIALSSPCFTLDIAEDESAASVSRKNYAKLKKVGHNIVKTNNNVSDESKTKILSAMGNKKVLNDTLKEVYDTEINKDINLLIVKKATEVMVATAISQNDKFDAATTIVLNIRLIMQIVVRCGYRPTYPQLSKLIIKVLRNAIIAYTIESLNLEEIIVGGINKLVKGALTAIPGLNEVAKGLTQGAANALLTLRIGILTRKYLYEEYNIQALIDNPEEENNEILFSACQEANDNIDTVIAGCKNRKANKAA